MGRMATQLRSAVGYRFRWYARGSRIRHATGPSLRVTRAMRGTRLTVRVRLTSGDATTRITLLVGRVR